MPYGVLPLSVLCENVLLQNHLAIRDLGDTRFQLIKRVLMKYSAQQLMNLEKWNPKLMLEDEEAWYNLVQREFPTMVHERYTTNISKIRHFFRQQLDEVGFDYSQMSLDSYVKYEELGSTKKFRLPSKLLYLKYREDYAKKEQLAIENLRQRTRAIQESKLKNRVVQIDEVIPVAGPKMFFKKPVPTRSKLFQKSQHEAKKRRDLFKNPLSLMPSPQPTKNLIKPELLRSNKPSTLSTPAKPPAARPKPPSPARKVPSIFIQPKRASSSRTDGPARSHSNSPRLNSPAKSEDSRPIKRMKLGEYVSRNTT